METVQYKNLKFQVWDLGGQTNIRPYWRCYYPNTNAIIFVVDSVDSERLGTARKELEALLGEEELRTSALLVFANKQDQRGALSEVEISDGLGLSGVKEHAWYICKTSALTGEGINAGLDWLVGTIQHS